eukprot:11205373-Lingulodinium_polyedra.AAC.1
MCLGLPLAAEEAVGPIVTVAGPTAEFKMLQLAPLLGDVVPRGKRLRHVQRGGCVGRLPDDA